LVFLSNVEVLNALKNIEKGLFDKDFVVSNRLSGQARIKAEDIFLSQAGL
jgi:hypothetical protein